MNKLFVALVSIVMIISQNSLEAGKTSAFFGGMAVGSLFNPRPAVYVEPSPVIVTRPRYEREVEVIEVERPSKRRKMAKLEKENDSLQEENKKLKQKHSDLEERLTKLEAKTK